MEHMTLTEEARRKVDDGLHSIETISEALGRTSDGLSSGANSIAWLVGVSSPGFLGLLWNAIDLAGRTRLPPPWFATVVLAAEMSFLTAIVAAVVAHAYVTRVATGLSIVNVHFIGIMAAARAAKMEGSLSSSTEKIFESSSAEIEKGAQWLLKLRKTPWPIAVCLGCHPYLELVGYALLAVLLATTRF
jgi:hypothetical protein